ncbi:hypothetical protein SDRG_16601 [Saprolegnia diclina VS20]|uniref:Uncharacterized protein n=1 Tax=Saprolegnia diclina (strain VS20) TaxID=1156394 RepID=T0R0M3_SAPDV|nr:hypothetical protein SDRG_16601 [Saprolegnia diclina VS20]EQC25518.1 hypothetical protein SDRG_16601 [Saprolegnia diclina VS20]|eukprot:XP_008621039.1 hypothetical protein SDRG_16601 [Saprolegnia diclina VS20]
MLNKGGMAFVHRDFLPWAQRLMLVVRSTFSLSRGNESLAATAASVTSDDVLPRLFDEAWTKAFDLNESLLHDTKLRDKLHKALQLSAMHARIGVVVHRFSAQYLGRHVDKSGTLALRQKLKAETGKTPQPLQGKRKAQTPVAAPVKSRQMKMTKMDPTPSATPSRLASTY